MKFLGLFFKGVFQNFYYHFKANPLFMSVTTMGSLYCVQSLVGLLFTWPSWDLLQYALGQIPPSTALQLSNLSIQYGSAWSFWLPLSVAMGSLMVMTIWVSPFFKMLYNGVRAGVMSNNPSFIGDAKQIETCIDYFLGYPEISKHIFLSHETFLFPPEIKNNMLHCVKMCDSNLEEALEKIIILDVVCLLKKQTVEMLNPILANLRGTESQVRKFNEIMHQHIQNQYVFPYLEECSAFYRRHFLEAIKPFEAELQDALGANTLDQHFFSQNRTPYSVLGLANNATEAMIERVYRTYTKQCHTDKVAGAEDRFLAINLAKKCLLNPALRRNVDQWIATHQEKNAVIEQDTMRMTKSLLSHYEEKKRASAQPVVTVPDEGFRAVQEKRPASSLLSLD